MMDFWPWNKIWEYWANKHIAETVEVFSLPSVGAIGQILVSFIRKEKMTTEKLFIEMIHIRVVREAFYIWRLTKEWKISFCFPEMP